MGLETFNGGGGDLPMQEINLEELISKLDKSDREKLLSGYNLRNLAKIFEDGETMVTVDSFLKHGLNISDSARHLYMHRNTLMYRLNKIRSDTGLDLRNFGMAVTFKILYILYKMK